MAEEGGDLFGEMELLLNLCLIGFVALEVELCVCLFASGYYKLEIRKGGISWVRMLRVGYLDVGTGPSGFLVQLSKILASDGVDGDTNSVVPLGGGGGSGGERCLMFLVYFGSP